MSYIEKIDRKLSIKKAKKELNHFSNLYTLHQNDLIYLKSAHAYTDSIISIINYINYDEIAISKIIKSDKQLSEISKVLKAISKLSKERELKYIYYKHIVRLKTNEILDVLKISNRTLARLSDAAYFDMALLLGIEVEQSKKEE